MSVKELTAKYPSIPWLEYFNKFLSGVVSINENEVINVEQPEFLNNLEKILVDYSVRYPRTLANYAVWRTIEDSMGYLNEEIVSRRKQFLSKIFGKSSPTPRFDYDSFMGRVRCFWLVGGGL